MIRRDFEWLTRGRECATCNYPAVRPSVLNLPNLPSSAVAIGVLREKCGSLARSFLRSAVLIFFDDRPPDARKVIKVTAAVRFPDLGGTFLYDLEEISAITIHFLSYLLFLGQQKLSYSRRSLAVLGQ